MISSEWLSIATAFFGTLISAMVTILAYLLNRQSRRAETQREIGQYYNKLMDFRADHPVVFSLSRKWKEDCFYSVYNQEYDEKNQWVLYYTYAEICLGFVNAVLYGHYSRLLDRHAYENHYKKLVKLILTEHYPFITTIMHGKYLSPYIITFVREEENDGWNWMEMHNALPGTPPKLTKVKKG
jgi:hypothetical protein